MRIWSIIEKYIACFPALGNKEKKKTAENVNQIV